MVDLALVVDLLVELNGDDSDRDGDVDPLVAAPRFLVEREDDAILIPDIAFFC